MAKRREASKHADPTHQPLTDEVQVGSAATLPDDAAVLGIRDNSIDL